MPMDPLLDSGTYGLSGTWKRNTLFLCLNVELRLFWNSALNPSVDWRVSLPRRRRRAALSAPTASVRAPLTWLAVCALSAGPAAACWRSGTWRTPPTRPARPCAAPCSGTPGPTSPWSSRTACTGCWRWPEAAQSSAWGTVTLAHWHAWKSPSSLRDPPKEDRKMI